jgi:hypothetical protein
MMGYILNYLLKISLFIIFLQNISFAEIDIQNIKKNEDGVNVDYKLNFQINDELEKLINKGISIEMTEEVIVHERRKYLPNRQLFKKINIIVIEFHPLIKKYYLKNSVNRSQYDNLNSLVDDLNRVKTIFLDLKIEDKKIYDTQIVWKINENSLPKSLQLNIKKQNWLEIDQYKFIL